MRDGIYKGLTLGRPWKRLLRWCEREADRGTRSESAAVNALERDFTREVSTDLIHRIQATAGSLNSLLPGLFSADLPQYASLTNRDRTPFEDILTKCFARNATAGHFGAELEQRSVSDGISEWKRRHYKLIQEHYLAEAGETASRDVLAAVRSALDSADVALIANRVLRGEKPSRVPLKRVDPDEDLR
jgi:hypothetical protein